MKKKISKLFAGVALGVMLTTGTAQAGSYWNGYYSIDCTLSYASKKATGTTNGAQYCGSDCYNRVLVCTRDKNGCTVSSAYAVNAVNASATTRKESKSKYANSYHCVADRRGNSKSPLYQQVVLRDN